MSDELEIVNSESAVGAMQRAEIDMQISTAKRYPRQLSKVKQDMMSFATLDQDTAASCFYSLPRGGKNIQGPSVRTAEIAVSCYGNMRIGSRVISMETKGDNPHVVVQAVARDLEKNIEVTIEKRRRILAKNSKNGQGKRPIDEDDINLAANSGAAIAYRDAAFKLIPRALINPVWEAAKKVAIGDAKTLKDRRSKAVDLFGKMGVSLVRILATLDKRSIEDIGLEELETLIGMHTAIKDGATTIDEAFPDPELVVKVNETKKAPSDDSHHDLQPQKKEEANHPTGTAAQQLADIVTQAGHTFDDFRQYTIDSGPPDAKPEDWGSFDDVPADWAARCVKAKNNLLLALKAMNTAGGAK